MEWEIFFHEHPFGQPRQDYLLGTLIASVCNAFRGSDSQPITLQDILYPRVVTQEEQIKEDLAYMDNVASMPGVIDLRAYRKKKEGDLPSK